jgi:hypothetical protein
LGNAASLKGGGTKWQICRLVQPNIINILTVNVVLHDIRYQQTDVRNQ